MNNQEVHLNLLRRVELNPDITQRELSKEMEVTLGKVYYCMQKMIEKGCVKLLNFNRNHNKVGYVYLLTPKGIEEKTRLTFIFLKIKMKEYEALKKEVSVLNKDTEKFNSN